MIPNTPVHGDNAVARVLGWEDEGRARVEFLNEAPGFSLGAVAVASVRPNQAGRRVIDFDYLRKAGLRTGGLVLLRKPVKDVDSGVTAKEIETLVPRRDSGIAVIKRSAAVCILPPPYPDTQIVTECLIAFLEESVAASEAFARDPTRLVHAMGSAGIFGQVGAFLTGEDRFGEIVELVLSADPDVEAGKFAEEFRASIPKEIAVECRRAKNPWQIVPFARIDVDMERSGKISAQRLNFDYGDADSPLWTPTDAVLRTFAGSWLAVDVSSSETPPLPPRLLMEIAEKAVA